MTTILLKISNSKDVGRSILDMQRNYSGMFRHMYRHAELLKDKGFEMECRNRFGLDSWMYRSCLVDVLTKLQQIKTINKNKSDLLESLEQELTELNAATEKGIKYRRHKFSVMRKIAHLRQSIDREVTFGGRQTLRKISYLHNTTTRTRKEKDKKQRDITAWTEKYHQTRLQPITIIGEAPQRSNRKFDFDFTNKRVIYKPCMGIKIPVLFYCSQGQSRQLEQLQGLIGNLAITVQLAGDKLYIVYDEESVAGYAFNDNACSREMRLIPKGSDKQVFRDCKKKWHKEREERMLSGKKESRVISFDLNPEYIGVAVLEKISGTNYRILHKIVYNLTGLNTRMGLSSSNPTQVYQNNRRDHEIKEIWKQIFNIAKHYNVSGCAYEDLEFKSKGVNDAPKQANRKTKNIWHRELTLKLITKHCSVLGIKKIAVNACYTTFIGNIKHPYFDPLNAAIETGRRGMMQFEGGFYPSLERTDLDTMSRLFGLDVQGKTISTWLDAHKAFKTAQLRYRRDLQQCKFEETNLLTHKNPVKQLNFYTN